VELFGNEIALGYYKKLRQIAFGSRTLLWHERSDMSEPTSQEHMVGTQLWGLFLEENMRAYEQPFIREEQPPLPTVCRF
jgi:hypothetical protein